MNSLDHVSVRRVQDAWLVELVNIVDESITLQATVLQHEAVTVGKDIARHCNVPIRVNGRTLK
jgi:hypothetical protein